jgi:hypothetical protein
MIYSYRKHIDALRTVEIALPYDEANHQRIGTELATINGVTFVHVPDTAQLPAQPAEITVEAVTLTPALIDEIKAASPHTWLINEQIKEKIREKYSAEDEMYYARISIGAITGQYTMEAGEAAKVAAYGVYVEEVRQWARDQRAALGL